MQTENTFLPTCIRGAPPPCAAACPFGVPVRELVKKLRRKSFDAAFHIYREAVVFPEIAHWLCGRACKGACAEKTGEAAIPLWAMEKACLAAARSPELPNLHLPEKRERVAVVGGGGSGLACAVRLASMNYPVVVFERAEQLGGALRDIVPAAVLERDIQNQLKNLDVQVNLYTEIPGLSQLGGFDAVYIATGRGGEDFGLASGSFPPKTGQNAYAGGGLLGASPAVAIRQGVQAAARIERFLKTGAFEEPQGEQTAPHPAAGREENAPAPWEPLDKEDTAEEARRCRLCDCSLCYDGCLFMQRYNKYPEKIAFDAAETANPTSFLVQNLVATRMVASCTDCGLCRQRCPSRIGVGDILMDARRQMEDRGNLPPPFHAFAMRDFDFSGGEEAALCRAPIEERPCKLLFFPGCQLGGVLPAQVLESYAFLRQAEPATGLMLQCCGAPARWAGRMAEFEANLARIQSGWRELGEPRLVVACPTCMRMLEEHLPQLPKISLYEVLALNAGALPAAAALPVPRALFDPCASRDFPGMQAAVRLLAQMQRSDIEELPSSGADALCCGNGGHIRPANPALADEIRGAGLAQSERDYLTYCGVCNDVFRTAGKPSRHILELLFPGGEEGPATLAGRFENRTRLKAEMLRRFWQAEGPAEPQDILLHIDEALAKKMTEELIWDRDIKQVIGQAEQSGCKLYLPERDSNLAHLQIGPVTYWAEFRKENGGYRLLNAYSHRLALKDDGEGRP